MKLYIRDPNTMLECKLTIPQHLNSLKENGTPDLHTWWNQLEVSAQCQDHNRFRKICEETLAEFGGRLCPGFWDRDNDEYIEFDDERLATLFLLRWM